MTNEHESRLQAMVAPEQQTWDLSPNDVAAIEWALRELQSAQAHTRNHHAEPCETCAALEAANDELKKEVEKLVKQLIQCGAWN